MDFWLQKLRYLSQRYSIISIIEYTHPDSPGATQWAPTECIWFYYPFREMNQSCSYVTNMIHYWIECRINFPTNSWWGWFCCTWLCPCWRPTRQTRLVDLVSNLLEVWGQITWLNMTMMVLLYWAHPYLPPVSIWFLWSITFFLLKNSFKNLMN